MTIKSKKNLLIFVNNIYSSLLMASFLLQKKKFNKNVYIIIEKRYSDGKINFEFTEQYSKLIKLIFTTIGFNNIFFYNRPKTYEGFSLRNIFKFSKIKKTNLEYRNNLLLFIKSNKINIKLVSEAWFTNDLISKIFLNKVTCKKIYFFHGLGDIMILKKKNLFGKSIDIAKHYINHYVYNIYFFRNKKDITYVNFFSKDYNQNLFTRPMTIKKDIYKNILLKISNNFKKIRFEKKILLITDNINLQKFNRNQVKIHSKFYIKSLVEYLNSQKNTKVKNIQFLFKWKSSVPLIHKKIFLNEFKNKGIIAYNVDDLLDQYVPLEFLLPNLKPAIVTSNYSSINFIITHLFPKIKILNTQAIYKPFEKEYFNYHNKLNLNHLLKNSEKIKKMLNKIPCNFSVKLN